jgi:integrase
MSESLFEILESLYFPLRALSIKAEHTRYQYRLALRDFGRFLGHDPTKSDLTDDNLTLWQAAMVKGDKARGLDKLEPITARERAGRVGALWNWLAKRRAVDRFPTFEKARARDVCPYALSPEQLRAFFASAGRERGLIDGIPAWLWCTSYFAFVFNTGERKTAALSVRIEWLDLASKACVVPPMVRKGGIKWGRYALWDETISLLSACINVDPQREMMWPFSKCEGSYYTMYNRILRDAGIPVNRHTKTHCLRVSFATWTKIFGGDPTEALGHSSSETFIRHYQDRTKTAAKQPKLFIPWKSEEERS